MTRRTWIAASIRLQKCETRVVFDDDYNEDHDAVVDELTQMALYRAYIEYFATRRISLRALIFGSRRLISTYATRDVMWDLIGRGILMERRSRSGRGSISWRSCAQWSMYGSDVMWFFHWCGRQTFNSFNSLCAVEENQKSSKLRKIQRTLVLNFVGISF